MARGKIVWTEMSAVSAFYNNSYKGANEDMGGSGYKALAPLNIKRTELIKRLEENLAEAKAEREKIDADVAAAKKAFQDFIADHIDQFANLVRAQRGGTWENALKNYEEEFEDDNYKSKESVQTFHETELDKVVRVLKMSTDETLEVTTDQPIYSLL